MKNNHSIGSNAKKHQSDKAELSIWLDSYDDIFSDFDSRPYNERALSDDFIFEARKLAKEKPHGKIILKLLMPSALRKQETETVIIKSIHSQFSYFANTIALEKKKNNQRGMLMTFAGFIIMAVAAYVSSLTDTAFYFNIIRVVLEPAGWFMVWSGLDHLIYIARKKNPELEFNSRIAHAEISFLTY